MTDKSINASDGLEKPYVDTYDYCYGPLLARVNASQDSIVVLEPNNCHDSGVNPTHCTETAY